MYKRQPRIRRILEEKKSGAVLHSDCVQAYGKVPFSVKELGADLVTVSAHKVQDVYKRQGYISVNQNPAEKDYSKPFNKVLEYIDNHYMEDMDLTLLSNKMDFSYHYFSKLFKRIVGKSYKQYLDYVRVTAAERFILDEDMNISEAANSVGTVSYTHLDVYKRQQIAQVKLHGVILHGIGGQGCDRQHDTKAGGTHGNHWADMLFALV